MTNKALIQNINKHFRSRSAVSTKELFEFIKSKDPKVPESTISWKIFLLKEAGELIHVSRGLYSFEDKGSFHPPISAQLKKLHHRIKKELPYLNFCIWDTRWLNGFMVHQINRFYIVVETEREGVESVFHRLSEDHKNVFLNPDKETLDRYGSNFGENIIVKPLITEAPTTTIDNIETISIEKLLVDCIVDSDLLSAQQDELEYIYQTAFEKYNININKAKRYARRRYNLDAFESMLKKSHQTVAR